MKPSSGGLVTALNPVLSSTGGCWVGWTGTDYISEVADVLQQRCDRPYSLAPVFLTEAEKRCFYHGCSNEILWPLFHDLQTRCRFDPEYWDVYRDVTEKYADAVERVAQPGDFVWVHDYHLMLMADALRARDLPLTLAYFQHIPFPQTDIFEKLPWRNEILRGLLQFNALGFQTAHDVENFVACVRHCLRDVQVERVGSRVLVRVGKLCTTAGAFPISIDFDEFATAADSPGVVVRCADIRRSLPGRIVLGVDRLDYTKGIMERLLAFRALLTNHSDLRGRVALVQVIVPSREEIPSYRDLRIALERLISEINGEFGKPGWTPIVYLHRCLSRAELVAMYRAADVALVTPLKDGMNLVAKEFCASRPDEQGVLVLSEFAGAANELATGALLVNPYDFEGAAVALHRALTMDKSEQSARMQRMRTMIRNHDVFDWCKTFCGRAVSPKRTVPDAQGVSAPCLSANAVA